MRAAQRLLAPALLAALAGAARGEVPAPDTPPGERPQVRVEQEPGAPSEDERLRSARALERGLAWLAAAQREGEDGSFPRGQARQHLPLPVTALAALALMAGGSTPERGPHGEAVARAVDYLLQRADLVPGSPTHGFLSSEGDPTSLMHGHAYATLALSQAYAMSPRSTRGRRTADVLAAAIGLIERSQGVEGGWMYQPRRTVEHENSVTVCLVQALRAARGAGVDVDAGTIARAVDYIRRCQDPDGAFRYGLATPQTTLALTAAGLTILNSAGLYEGPAVERGMQNLWQGLNLRAEGAGRASGYPYYERFYLAQALWQAKDRRLFERWAAEERERVLADQKSDGSWHDPQFGSAYATAMNCLFLALPDGLLPIFQR